MYVFFSRFRLFHVSSTFPFFFLPLFFPTCFFLFLILDAVLRHDTKDSSSDRRTSRRYTIVHLKICPSSIKVAAHAARMANVHPSGYIDFRRLTALVNFEQSYHRYDDEGAFSPWKIACDTGKRLCRVSNDSSLF